MNPRPLPFPSSHCLLYTVPFNFDTKKTAEMTAILSGLSKGGGGPEGSIVEHP